MLLNRDLLKLVINYTYNIIYYRFTILITVYVKYNKYIVFMKQYLM